MVKLAVVSVAVLFAPVPVVATVPMMVAPSLNCTLPVGSIPTTVAVKVMLTPATAVLGAVSVVVVVVAVVPTVTTLAAEVTALFLGSVA